MTIEDVIPNEVNELEDEFVHSELQSQLKREILEVTFTKVNGEKRIMNCTLMEGILPSNPTEEAKKEAKKKVNEDVLSVWDVDSSGWRSFRMNTVTRVRQIMAHGGGNA
jgi:uncharacterized protein (DUF4415 family)